MQVLAQQIYQHHPVEVEVLTVVFHEFGVVPRVLCAV